MSEIERNKVEDVDTIVEVVAEAQEADRRRLGKAKAGWDA